jgi:hypothetical protein
MSRRRPGGAKRNSRKDRVITTRRIHGVAAGSGE